MTLEQTQLDGEPMVNMTVRQRDSYLYMIKSLKSEVDMLRAEIARLNLDIEHDPGQVEGT